MAAILACRYNLVRLIKFIQWEDIYANAKQKRMMLEFPNSTVTVRNLCKGNIVARSRFPAEEFIPTTFELIPKTQQLKDNSGHSVCFF